MATFDEIQITGSPSHTGFLTHTLGRNIACSRSGTCYVGSVIHGALVQFLQLLVTLHRRRAAGVQVLVEHLAVLALALR